MKLTVDEIIMEGTIEELEQWITKFPPRTFLDKVSLTRK